MIISYSDNRYRITYGGVSMVENALGNPNLVQVAVTSGCTIQLAPDERYGITYKANGEYASWRLNGINTRLNRAEKHYIYARINRADDKGLIIFSVNRYRTDGKVVEEGAEMTHPTPKDPVIDGSYYYILIGTITKTNALENATELREIKIDGGFLTTPQGQGSLNNMFRIIQGNLIQPLMHMASHVIEGTLEITGHLKDMGRLILNGKSITGVAREIDEPIAPVDDETVPTTAYLAGKFVDKILGDKFLRKDKPDTAKEIITFLKGIMLGQNGSGITVLPDGTSQAVVDRLYVKIKAYFEELEVQRKTYVGGSQILTPSGMKCIKVEDKGTCWRCYIKAEEEGIEVRNTFTKGAQAFMKECNIKVGVNHHVGNRYFWRLVTEVGPDWIEVSKTDCDEHLENGVKIENDAPAPGDDIIGLGHRTDIGRQAAIAMSSVDKTSPSIIFYQGIDSFTLDGKEVIELKYNKTTGQAEFNVYGRAYIGDRNKTSFVSYSKEEGLKVKGHFYAEGSDKEMGEDIDAAKKAAEEAKTQAGEAKTAADQAQQKLTDWASDKIISPLEKPGLREELERIDSEHDNINENYRKNDAGVPSAYNDAHKAYRNMLVALTADKPEAIPVPENFNEVMAKYYNERTLALNALNIVIEIGAENLLRNTGFTGDFESRDLTDATLEPDDVMYSNPLDYWDGKATVIADAESASGFAAQLGNIEQRVRLVADDAHLVSLKAKGASVTVSINGVETTTPLAGAYQRVVVKFTSMLDNVVSFSGNCTVCEIKLERGTIATDWGPHKKDRNEVADRFRKFWYLLDALGGTTTIDGGMVLTSVIRLGQWQDGKLVKENGAINGIYNDDDDIAYCAGGDLDKAINTVTMYRNDPLHLPTEAEMKNIANVVITHGGLAILSKVIVRGGVYADYGVFRGEVHADGGVFKNIKNPNGLFTIDESGRLHTINAEIEGVVKRPWAKAFYGSLGEKLDPSTGQFIPIMGFDCTPEHYDKLMLEGTAGGDVYLSWGENASGRDIMIWNNLAALGNLQPSAEIKIQEGFYLYYNGYIYSPKDEFRLRSQCIACLTSFKFGWLVTDIIDLTGESGSDTPGDKPGGGEPGGGEPGGNKPGGGGNADLTGYATEAWVKQQGYLKSLPKHTHSITDVTGLATKHTTYDTHVGNTAIHVTQENKNAWNAKLDSKVWNDVFTVDDKGLHVKVNLIGEKEVSAYSKGTHEGTGGSVTVDSVLSMTSENPVQNKVVTAAIGDLSSLSTNHKVSLVAAINELYLNGGSGAGGSDIDLTGYATQNWVNNQGFLKALPSHTHAISEVTGLASKHTTYDAHIKDTASHVSQTDRTNWNGAAGSKHTHTNKAQLDAVGVHTIWHDGNLSPVSTTGGTMTGDLTIKANLYAYFIGVGDGLLLDGDAKAKIDADGYNLDLGTDSGLTGDVNIGHVGSKTNIKSPTNINGNTTITGNLDVTGEITAHSTGGDLVPFLIDSATTDSITQAPTAAALKRVNDEKDALAAKISTIKTQLESITATSSIESIRTVLMNISKGI